MFNDAVQDFKSIIEINTQPEERFSLRARGASFCHGIIAAPILLALTTAKAVEDFSGGLLNRNIEQLKNAGHAALMVPILAITHLALGIFGLISPSGLKATAEKLDKVFDNNRFFEGPDMSEFDSDKYRGWKKRVIYPIVGLTLGPAKIVEGIGIILHSPLVSDPTQERKVGMLDMIDGFKMPFEGISEMIRPAKPKSQPKSQTEPQTA